ncbi:MAG TPA: heavy metal translocating P-type ATPase [Anaeromyxobacter sp.]|nr:heavy metal translocating P-type ATPase [Anaeromyxobacter sp.]
MGEPSAALRPVAATCDHCLAKVPPGEERREVVAGAERLFCCAGCRGAYRLIHEEGLGRYYAERHWVEVGPAAAAHLDLPAFQAAVREVEGEAELSLAIDGIRCASCVWLSERLLSRTAGVRSARVSYATHRARVRFDPQRTDLEALLGRICTAGYQPRPWSDSARRAAGRAEVRDLLVRLGTAAFLVSQLMIYQAALYAGYFQGIDAGSRRLLEWISLGLTLPVYLYCGAPFLRGTVRSLRAGALGMDALVAAGSGAALVYSIHGMLRGGEVYFDTAAMIPTLVLLGRLVEAVARGRASEAVARLAALQPRQARRVCRGPEGSLVRAVVAVSALAPGDRIEVAPGERVAADGEVVAGRSEVDESLVTGEPTPVEKGPGSRVIGGTVNRFGALLVEVRRVGETTLLAGIVRAVEEAQASKPRLQAAADRAVAIFVPALLLLAAGTTAAWLSRGAPVERAIMAGIAVVVIACPCALGLATPIAILVSAALASSKGILLRGGEALWRAGRVTEVLLDKTGTLTRGCPELGEMLPLAGGLDRDRLLALAAAAERPSEHHLGAALREAARVLPGPLEEPEAFRAVPGRGVVATIAGAEVLVGNRALFAEHGVELPEEGEAFAAEREGRGETVVWVARAGRCAGLLALADPIRPEAPAALRSLRRLGLEPRVWSGDAPRTTASLARALGLEHRAGASPVEKREEVARLQRLGRRVLFAGDGLNDAPALTQADVGVAVGRGADVTLESADAVLVRGDLSLLPDLVRLSRRTAVVIRQNVFWAFFYNVAAVPLAMAGVLHPIVAAAAMAASSLFVVGNSLRLRRALGPP